MQSESNLTKSIYRIAKMDCSAEEQMVRKKLESFINIKKLDFDLTERTLSVIHLNDNDEITKSLDELELDSNLIESKTVDE